MSFIPPKPRQYLHQILFNSPIIRGSLCLAPIHLEPLILPLSHRNLCFSDRAKDTQLQRAIWFGFGFWVWGIFGFHSLQLLRSQGHCAHTDFQQKERSVPPWGGGTRIPPWSMVLISQCSELPSAKGPGTLSFLLPPRGPSRSQGAPMETRMEGAGEGQMFFTLLF